MDEFLKKIGEYGLADNLTVYGVLLNVISRVKCDPVRFRAFLAYFSLAVERPKSEFCHICYGIIWGLFAGNIIDDYERNVLLNYFLYHH